jgi:hypothetical protein
MTTQLAPRLVRVRTEPVGILAFRRWVTDHPVSSAILAGLVATHLATVIGYWMPGVGLPRLDWNRVNGAIFTPNQSPVVQFVSGGFFHYADGIVLSLLFALLMHPRLPGRNTPLNNVLKGLAFGTLLTIIALVFMVPRVYLPHDGVGFFSINLGWKFLLAVFLWHVVYGLHLGAVYNPLPRDEPGTAEAVE